MIKIRPAQPETDIPGIRAVVNMYEREPLSLGAIQRWFEHLPPGRIARRMVAVDEQKTVIGYSVSVHEAWQPAGQYFSWVVVDPAWRGRGVGRALAQDQGRFLRQQGARRIKSDVRDDDARSLEFARRYGFTVERHQFTSRLDLTAFDEAPFRVAQDKQTAAGIRFGSLADFPDGPARRLALYTLNRAVSLDAPGAEGDFMAFEEYEQWVCAAEWFRPEGQLIALDGEQWVGLCALQLLPENQGAFNLITGVLPAYRRRQIAQALKLLAIRYARRHGAKHISTTNDSLNVAMLAINRKLG